MVNTLALVLAAALAPGAGDDLKISNVRAAYSDLGPVRRDDRVLPGDIYFVAFDIDNVKVTDEGELKLSMAMQVTNSKGDKVYTQDFKDMVQLNSLGGTRVPGFAHVIIGRSQPPGKHTLTVTVKDRAAHTTASFNREFDILPPGFGIVRFKTSVDADGLTTVPAEGVVGQQLYINFWVIGAEPAKKGPHVTVKMVVLDEDGKQTLKAPAEVSSKGLAKDTVVVPVSLYLALNRAGKFKIKLTATDENNKNTRPAELSFLVTVNELR